MSSRLGECIQRKCEKEMEREKTLCRDKGFGKRFTYARDPFISLCFRFERFRKDFRSIFRCSFMIHTRNIKRKRKLTRYGRDRKEIWLYFAFANHYLAVEKISHVILSKLIFSPFRWRFENFTRRRSFLRRSARPRNAFFYARTSTLGFNASLETSSILKKKEKK